MHILISPLLSISGRDNTPSPDPSAALDIVAKASDKGLLIPRVPLQNITDITTVPNPAVSLLVTIQLQMQELPKAIIIGTEANGLDLMTVQKFLRKLRSNDSYYEFYRRYIC
jgi:hypothetical protein